MSRLIGFSVVVLFLLGCGGQSGPDGPDTSPATGVVTYKGQPVEGATVTFVATAGGKGAMGTTDASGKFNLLTFPGPVNGAVHGSYAVKISKTTGGAVAMTDAEAMEMMSSGKRPPKPAPEKDHLPTKYKDAKTSGLKAEVKEGDNEFTFDLTD